MIGEPTVAVDRKGKLALCECDAFIANTKGGKNYFVNVIEEVTNAKEKVHAPATAASTKYKD